MNGKSITGYGGPAKARIFIVDDHPLVREGLRQIINRQDDLECCGEAEGVVAAQKQLSLLKPDLVTVDLRLQNGDGMELLKIIRAQRTGMRMLVISQCDETLYAERTLKAGARGYVMKERATEEVLTAIRTIINGGIYVSPRIAALTMTNMVGSGSVKSGRDVSNLSDRELQILQLLGAGLGTRKVADRLFLSVKTVETHRENIKHKLGLANAAELIRYATEWVEGHTSQIPAHQATGLEDRQELQS